MSLVTLAGTADKKSLPAILTAITPDVKGTHIDHTKYLVRPFRNSAMLLRNKYSIEKQYPSAIYLRTRNQNEAPHSIQPIYHTHIHACAPRFLVRFTAGNVPVADDKYLKEYDPATPIYRGWKAYRQAPRAVSTAAGGNGGEETSLERAMRLRHELLGVLQDCSGMTAAATAGTTTSGASPSAEEYQVLAVVTGKVVTRYWLLSFECHFGGVSQGCRRFSLGVKHAVAYGNGFSMIQLSRDDR